jgi:hypothetical protein
MFYNAVIEVGCREIGRCAFGSTARNRGRASEENETMRRNVSRTIDLDLFAIAAVSAETTQCCNYHIPG